MLGTSPAVGGSIENWVMFGNSASVPYSMRSNTSAKAGTIENAGLPVYPDNAAALAGGLVAEQLYCTSTGDLKIVY